MLFLKIKKHKRGLFVITSIEFFPILQPLTILYAWRDFLKIVIHQRFCNNNHRIQWLYWFIKSKNNSNGFEKKKQ